MNRVLLLLVLFVPALAWAHEGHAPANTDFATDRCAECNMFVTSRQYAAQIVGSGAPLFFDDIGCLVQYERQGKVAPDAVHARYVRSVNTDAWLDVRKAIWVTTKDVRTPMGYGLHAFADQAAAQAFVQGKKNAKVVAWADVPALVPASMGMGKM